MNASEEHRKSIGNLAETIAQESGHPNLRAVIWDLREYIHLKELDPAKSTGPGGHVWELLLGESGRPVASIRFTDLEIEKCETDKKDVIEARLREAINKL